ncbi:MAG: transporter associated domain-containing protein, partial [Bacilli bacterium]
HYLISTEMDLDDLFDKLNLGEVPETKYASVGGFVYELCDGLPTEGQEISYESIYENYSLEKPVVFTYNLTFIIKRVENRRIKSIELIVVIKNEEPLT